MKTNQQNSNDCLSSCPSHDEIHGWLIGRFDEPMVSRLQQHFESCTKCEQTLSTLDIPSDEVIQKLSELPPLDEDEADYRRLRQQLLATQVSFPDDQLAITFLEQAQRLADPQLGALPFRLGNYELLECIGRGASGAVYRAQHVNLERTVAVKVLGSIGKDGAQAIERFIAEMKVIGSLAHPHIVRATDAGEVDGLHFLVMDFVEGIDAAQLLFRQGKLSVPVSCEIVRQAALGLDFAHSKSLIHRDVKPSNLLVAAPGQVKLLDLGVATRIERSPSEQLPGQTSGQATDKSIVGTLSYMAPEQRSALSNLDARADIYGLGKTLLKLLTGRNVSSSDLGIDQLRSDVPADVRSLLSRMVATNPDDRPATAKEVAKALSPHADQRDLINLVTKLFPNRDGSVIPSDEFPAPTNSSMVTKRTRRRWIGAAIGLSIVAALAAVWISRTWIEKTRERASNAGDANLLSPADDPEANFNSSEDQQTEIRSDDILLPPNQAEAKVVYTVTGIFNSRGSHKLPIAAGESFTAVFEIDDSVVDSQPDNEKVGEYVGAIVSGSFSFAGGYTSKVDFSGGKIVVLPDNGGGGIGLNSPSGDGAILIYSTETFASDALLNSTQEITGVNLKSLWVLTEPGGGGPLSSYSTPMVLAVSDVSSTIHGDVDSSGAVDFNDIPGFVLVLFGNGFQAQADCDQNGRVDLYDIPAFVGMLLWR